LINFGVSYGMPVSGQNDKIFGKLGTHIHNFPSRNSLLAVLHQTHAFIVAAVSAHQGNCNL